MSVNIDRKKEGGLTSRQQRFIELYPEILDVYKTAELSGIARSNIMADLKRNSSFAATFRELSENIDKDPRYSKVGSIGALQQMKESINGDEELDSKDKYRLLLDIQKEINKMIDGNIATQRKVVEKKDYKFEAVYDFTSLPEQGEPKTIDIKAEEV